METTIKNEKTIDDDAQPENPECPTCGAEAVEFGWESTMKVWMCGACGAGGHASRLRQAQANAQQKYEQR
jgi:ribosomal protein L37AE/L43A